MQTLQRPNANKYESPVYNQRQEKKMIPRFQGKLSEGDDGKFYFEIFISFLGSGEPKSLGMFGPWETKEISEKAMWNAIKICCEQAGYKSGSYIDMKTNQTKSFEK